MKPVKIPWKPVENKGFVPPWNEDFGPVFDGLVENQRLAFGNSRKVPVPLVQLRRVSQLNIC